MDTLRLLDARDIAALYYGTWRLLVDAQDNQALPRSHRLANPGGRIELANQYQQLLAEAILLLPSEDRRKAEVVCDYLDESLDMAMRDLGRDSETD
jgi:hypothetical protein